MEEVMTYKTIVESPKRQLERELGIARGGSSGLRACSWQKLGDGTPVRCGLLVWDIADERHVGRIERYNGAVALIRWEESGWFSEVAYRDLRQAEGV